MKKIGILILIIIGSISIIILGFNYKVAQQPNTYYKVYLDREIIGVIDSKQKLENYIDKQGKHIKEKFHVNKVYAPNGLQIKKINTYEKKTDKVDKVYKLIHEKKPFTIKGYQFTLVKGNKKQTIYTLSKKTFNESIKTIIKLYVGKKEYSNYINKNQSEIETTGTIIKNIYIDEDITIKRKQIPVEKKVYTKVDDLSQYMLYGDKIEKSSYTIKTGDTIGQVAFNNKISAEEFLISNKQFTSSTNLLFAGQEVSIVKTNPQINVVVEEFTVKDVVNNYQTEEKFDSSRIEGDDELIQKGTNGLERVTQNVKKSNREILYVDPVSKQEIEPTINEIIIRGDKIIPTVGSLTNWAWPTASGYTISSDYSYRISPMTGGRELHDGIDISGTGYGSPIYAANNGVIVQLGFQSMNGNYITINHNNGYYTIYAHMSSFNTTKGATVAKGQIIGYIGSTGASTGPHLHFGVAKNGIPYYGGYMVSPWVLFK
ncbi:MAG: M23 family metallopeptidase [Bacilli bacterium]